MKTFKVKITSAERSTYWYANRIGEVFSVTDAGTDYKVSNNYSTYISKCDCEVVKDFDIKEVIAGALVHNANPKNAHLGAKGIDNGKFVGYLMEFPLTGNNPAYYVIDENGKPTGKYIPSHDQGLDFQLSIQPEKKVQKWRWVYVDVNGDYDITIGYYATSEEIFSNTSGNNVVSKIEESMREF